MVQKCPVLLNNDAVTVISFNGTEVQLPSIKQALSSVNVLYKNGKYSIVSDDYKEDVEKVDTHNKYQNKYFKKTTNDDKVEDRKTVDDNE